MGDTTKHWPAEQTTPIGAITSFLVPIDAVVRLKHIEQGMMAPLTIFGEPSHEQMRSSRNIIPAWVDIDHDAKKFRWVHVNASSFGASEVKMDNAKGWNATMKLNMVYPSPTEKATRAPVALTLGEGGMQTAEADGRDNIEVTASGKAADGWTATPEAETGFKLIRIEQVAKTSGEPQVKLFFAGTSSPKDSTMVLKRGSGKTAKTMKFKIKAIPTIAC
ncbi:hypothetical protein C7C56_015490 [Massilia glaciei]|uniref:Uncharacterized protein n=1 Tax=Massilia glaciei TaxID=1524097 RepID=A0A2U2HIZ7_9BURK|nr:hypothetical protein C7C56_015490 [Massilia glaciei]